MAFDKNNNIATGGKTRQSNLELCRILAILLVVLVHANFAWCGWPSNFSECNFARLLTEGFAIIGVNVFVLITGYFSTSIKIKSLANLVYICLFYAVIRLLVGYVTGCFDIKDIFFISKSNWFIPSYIGLLLFTPFLNNINLNKRQLRNVIIALVAYEVWFGYLPALPQVLPGFQYGYSLPSFMIIYLIARYIRLYDLPSTFYKFSVIIYIGCSFILAAEAYFLLKIFADTGKDMVNPLNHLVYCYNNPIVILSSISFFCFFKNIEIGYSKFINYIAGSVLAVLLIHTSAPLNPLMKEYFIFSLENYSGVSLVLIWILGLVSIFVFCVVIDQLRILSYRLIKTMIHIFTDKKLK